MLTDEEARWLDTYQARVGTTLAPLVDAETRRWLESATRPLARV
jgi:Xaa-Pro aminopeptidase